MSCDNCVYFSITTEESVLSLVPCHLNLYTLHFVAHVFNCTREQGFVYLIVFLFTCIYRQGFVYGAKEGKRLQLFIDDLNLPHPDQYGVQRCNEVPVYCHFTALTCFAVMQCFILNKLKEKLTCLRCVYMF